MRAAVVVVVAAVIAAACSKRAPQGDRPAPPGGGAVVVSHPAIADHFRANYTKFEYRIPMRDGVRLFTAVYVPNDAGPGRRYPIVLNRTPYSVAPYGADRYKGFLVEPMVREGYVFVFQDVRGKFMSEGTWVETRPIIDKKKKGDVDESTDAWDTIDWLVRHVDFNNGKVGLMGQSYDGFYATTGAIDSHPALDAVLAMAPMGDLWIGDDVHRNGTLAIQPTFAFYTRFGVPRPEPVPEEHAWPAFDYGTPDAYQFFLDLGPMSAVDASVWKNEIVAWNEIKAHPDYDAYWQSRAVPPRLRNVRAAVWFIGGWYDTEDLYGTLESYRALEKQNRGIANTITMGPWTHGGWWGADEKVGDANAGYVTSRGMQDRMNAFFAHHLKGGTDPRHAEAEVFETGANRWRRFAAWPPKEVAQATFYLREDGAIAREAATADGFDEYISDPERPVPYTADPKVDFPPQKYAGEDQRFASRRPDVLVYQTPAFEDELTIAGPIDVELYVSTTGTDADFVVKVIDVWPGKPSWQSKKDLENENYGSAGKQILVRGEPFRGRYRESFEKSVPFVPGQVAKISFRLEDVFHTFLRGHRLMVHVQSSWFPYFDRNPQTFVPNIFEATREHFVKATHRVHRGAATASRLVVNVLPRRDEAR
jgi:putative CocE/NonD family hydrolase